MAIRNDKELIDYCKENNYVYVDYSFKFKEVNEKTLDLLNEIIFKRRDNPKYEKCIYRIDLSKVDKRIKYTLYKKFNIQSKNDMSLYINKKNTMVFANDLEMNRVKIKALIDNEKQNCSICLETIDTKDAASCVSCSACFHIDCIENPKYPCRDFQSTYCCVCKEIMGSVIWF